MIVNINKGGIEQKLLLCKITKISSLKIAIYVNYKL